MSWKRQRKLTKDDGDIFPSFFSFLSLLLHVRYIRRYEIFKLLFNHFSFKINLKYDLKEERNERNIRFVRLKITFLNVETHSHPVSSTTHNGLTWLEELVSEN